MDCENGEQRLGGCEGWSHLCRAHTRCSQSHIPTACNLSGGEGIVCVWARGYANMSIKSVMSLLWVSAVLTESSSTKIKRSCIHHLGLVVFIQYNLNIHQNLYEIHVLSFFFLLLFERQSHGIPNTITSLLLTALSTHGFYKYSMARDL